MGDLGRDFDGQFVFNPQHCMSDVSPVCQGCLSVDDDVLFFYSSTIDVRHRDLVAKDMHRFEKTYCLHSRQLSPFLAFHRLFPVA